MAWPRPHLGVLAAGVWPKFVNLATAGFSVQKAAIAVGPACKREQVALVVEMVDLCRFHQPASNLLWLFMLGFEWIDEPQPHKVWHANLHGHGAAVGHAAVAQAFAVA